MLSDTLTPDLQRKFAKSKDTKKVLKAMGTVLVNQATRAFNEPSLRPTPWAPLKPSTLKNKARKGLSDGILKATGTLMRSIRIVSVDNNDVKVGTDREYAAYHQWGTKRAPKGQAWVKGTEFATRTIPPRPFLPIEDGMLTEKAEKLVHAGAKRVLDAELGFK